jgi:CRP/FNR family transcriptional regulator, cyclic AMP receptor protein
MPPHATIAAAATTITPDSFYGMLTEQDQLRLRRQGIVQMHRPGTQLMLQGAPLPGPAILIRGWARSFAPAAHKAMTVLHLYGPGDLLGGETAIALEQHYPETVTAVGSCLSLTLPGPWFAELISANRNLGTAFENAMLQRVRDTEERLKSRFFPVSERLVHLLADLADRFGVRAPDGITIPIELPQDELADLIGASRSPVARTLKDLRARGMIHTGYRRITITGDLLDALRRDNQRTSYLLPPRGNKPSGHSPGYSLLANTK